MLNELDPNTQQYTQPTEQPEAPAPVEAAPAEKQPVESDRENNLRVLRERAEAAERRAQELERSIHTSYQQQAAPKQVEAEDEDDDINDDMYLDGRTYKKQRQLLKKEAKETRQQLEQMRMESAEIKLRQEFPDFTKVVNQENMAKLAQNKPLLYKTIIENKDWYTKGYTAYEMLMGSGIVPIAPREAVQRIQENHERPKSMSSAAPQTSNSPLAKVGDYDRRILSKERQDEIRRMVEINKSYRPS
jgi:hypothetical protein